MYRGSVLLICGATTGWLAVGGRLVPLPPPLCTGGTEGRAGNGKECWVLTAAGASVDTLLGISWVLVGFGVLVFVDEVGVGVVDTGGTTVDRVGVGVGVDAGADESTLMKPCPVRTPSVAVTPAVLVAVKLLEAVAGVRAGSRSENDDPDTVTVTETSVRLANRTHPPFSTYAVDTLKVRLRPAEIVIAAHDAADAFVATTAPATPVAAASSSATRAASCWRRVTPPW